MGDGRKPKGAQWARVREKFGRKLPNLPPRGVHLKAQKLEGETSHITLTKGEAKMLAKLKPIKVKEKVATHWHVLGQELPEVLNIGWVMKIENVTASTTLLPGGTHIHVVKSQEVGEDGGELLVDLPAALNHRAAILKEIVAHMRKDIVQCR